METHHLLDQGWLELRRGSGLYVRPQPPSGDGAGQLDTLLIGLLGAARRQGHEPEEVLRRLEQLIHPRECSRIAVFEPDPAMREILLAEIREHLRIPVDAIELSDLSDIPALRTCLVVSLPTRAAMLHKRVAKGTPFLRLRLRSVGASLETQTRPGPNVILSIVSRSHEFRQWARAFLLAVGLEPDCLCEIDTAMDAEWRERVRAGTLAITDVVTARLLPAGCPARVFRVIADTTVAEIKQICGNSGCDA